MQNAVNMNQTAKEWADFYLDALRTGDVALHDAFEQAMAQARDGALELAARAATSTPCHPDGSEEEFAVSTDHGRRIARSIRALKKGTE